MTDHPWLFAAIFGPMLLLGAGGMVAIYIAVRRFSPPFCNILAVLPLPPGPNKEGEPRDRVP